MDPFEARLQFKQLLTTINPSHQAIQKVISYALKNYELHEDLHSVILERLGQLDMNARMNVLVMIEGLISSVFAQFGNSEEDDLKPYVESFTKDFYIILEKIITRENLINLNSTSHILKNVEQCYRENKVELGGNTGELIEKYEAMTIDNLRKEFGSDEIIINKIDLSETVFEKCWLFLTLMKRRSLINRFNQINNIQETNPIDSDITIPLKKDQMINRMESDRERHKKLKESNWIVNRITSQVDEQEFSKLWEQFNELNEEDYIEIDELNQIVKESYQI
ncbi:hypothetical protein WICPIJ_006914 [Wickerhamomyces pijperi]|uniref:CID domain-containing protein n=1 Tax=Wickerhamomyces pijperi TaxID=599730 RepID=A0A9P8TKF2_WICPI|nr:hypothetical protein WICPIJ_006914 [Wickerhamomyces pijperi]